jgi:hypothetical protein
VDPGRPKLPSFSGLWKPNPCWRKASRKQIEEGDQIDAADRSRFLAGSCLATTDGGSSPRLCCARLSRRAARRRSRPPCSHLWGAILSSFRLAEGDAMTPAPVLRLAASGQGTTWQAISDAGGIRGNFESSISTSSRSASTKLVVPDSEKRCVDDAAAVRARQCTRNVTPAHSKATQNGNSFPHAYLCPFRGCRTFGLCICCVLFACLPACLPACRSAVLRS